MTSVPPLSASLDALLCDTARTYDAALYAQTIRALRWREATLALLDEFAAAHREIDRLREQNLALREELRERSNVPKDAAGVMSVEHK